MKVTLLELNLSSNRVTFKVVGTPDEKTGEKYAAPIKKRVFLGRLSNGPIRERTGRGQPVEETVLNRQVTSIDYHQFATSISTNRKQPIYADLLSIPSEDEMLSIALKPKTSKPNSAPNEFTLVVTPKPGKKPYFPSSLEHLHLLLTATDQGMGFRPALDSQKERLSHSASRILTEPRRIQISLAEGWHKRIKSDKFKLQILVCAKGIENITRNKMRVMRAVVKKENTDGDLSLIHI